MGKRKKLPHFLQGDVPERLLRGTHRLRNRLMLMCALYLGLRCAEVCKLQVGHIDFGRRLLFVREGKGARDRCLPLPKRLHGPLRGWIGTRTEGPVFPSPHGGILTNAAVRWIVKQAAIRAGLPDATAPRRYHLHALRHVFASRMLERGAPLHEVQAALGHGSIATTSIYLHADPERLRASMEV